MKIEYKHLLKDAEGASPCAYVIEKRRRQIGHRRTADNLNLCVWFVHRMCIPQIVKNRLAP